MSTSCARAFFTNLANIFVEKQLINILYLLYSNRKNAVERNCPRRCARQDRFLEWYDSDEWKNEERSCSGCHGDLAPNVFIHAPVPSEFRGLVESFSDVEVYDFRHMDSSGISTVGSTFGIEDDLKQHTAYKAYYIYIQFTDMSTIHLKLIYIKSKHIYALIDSFNTRLLNCDRMSYSLTNKFPKEDITVSFKNFALEIQDHI